jgi:ABC-2 type transport system permease protein
MTIFKFALVRGLRKKLTLIVLCIVPLIIIFIKPLWTGDSYGFTFYGVVILLAAFLLVRSIMTDRVSGMAIRIFAAPVTTFQYLFQNLMAFLLLLSCQITVLVIIGALLYKWHVPMAMKLFICYILFAVTSIAFSLAWNSLFHSRDLSDGIIGVVISIMSLLGGITMPLEMLPGFLRRVGMVFPTYWLSSAILAVLKAQYHNQYLISLTVLVLLTAAFLVFGSKRRLE